jgi:hypothetical protein
LLAVVVGHLVLVVSVVAVAVRVAVFLGPLLLYQVRVTPSQWVLAVRVLPVRQVGLLV